MATLIFFDDKNIKHTVWSEYVNESLGTLYWEKVNGVSNQITKRKFEMLQKKYA